MTDNSNKTINAQKSKKKDIIIIVLLSTFSLFFLIAIGIIVVILLGGYTFYSFTNIDDENIERLTEPIIEKFDSADNYAEEEENDSNDENSSVSENAENDSTKVNVVTDFPFDLPADSPFTVEEISGLYNRADERLFISYREAEGNTESAFQEEIDPYLQLFVASMQYSYEKYNEIFQGKNPKLDARESLSLTVYESCMDISVGLSEETCSDVKMVGSMSPFTYGTSFYVNKDHPEFDISMIIDVGTHEVIHLLQYTYDDHCTGSTMPDWFKESMAVGLAYSSDDKTGIYLEDYETYGAPKDLDEMEEFFGNDTTTMEQLGQLRSSYYIAGDFFDYIMEYVSLEDYVTLLPLASTYRSEDDNSEFNVEFEKLTGYLPGEIYSMFLSTL